MDDYTLGLRALEIRESETRAWHTEPLPEGVETILLEFRDVTPDHKTWVVTEVWAPETVACTVSESFEHAAQRFRVQANKKYRHPFLHSMQFDAILKSERTSLTNIGQRTVAEVLAELSEERVVPYVRNDEDNRGECSHSPVRFMQFWERTLPEWFVTPEHWIEPTPPPGFDESKTSHALNEHYYKKVPTLHVPGNGRMILPSTKKPEIISRALFMPVRDWGLADNRMTDIVNLHREDDFVPHGAHLVPGKITLDAARALLGRVIQCSSEPRPDPDASPAVKRRKINKFAAQRLGIAWGIELEEDGTPGWLHCIWLSAGTYSDQFVLDLTGANRLYEQGIPIAVRSIPCAWVGIAVLPADRQAMKSAGTQQTGSAEVQDGPAGAKKLMSFNDWSDRTHRWVKKMNRKKTAPVVEVGPCSLIHAQLCN